MAHARLPNGKILKTGFGCIEELQFTSAFIRCGGDCFSMGVMLRMAALLGRHMTVSPGHSTAGVTVLAARPQASGFHLAAERLFQPQCLLFHTTGNSHKGVSFL